MAVNCNNKDFFNGYDLRFKIKNDSNFSIYNSISIDTTISYINPSVSNSSIQPNATEIHTINGRTWETLIEDTPKDTISLFIFSSDTINKYPWDSVRSNYMILQRYDLSLKDLQNRNWTIEYPYDSSKGNMKVWKR